MARRKKDTLKTITNVLLIVGAINWGLAIWNFNIVQTIANSTASWVGTIIYSLIALSGIYKIFNFCKK